MRKDIKLGVVIGLVLLVAVGWYIARRGPEPASPPTPEPIPAAPVAEEPREPFGPVPAPTHEAAGIPPAAPQDKELAAATQPTEIPGTADATTPVLPAAGQAPSTKPAAPPVMLGPRPTAPAEKVPLVVPVPASTTKPVGPAAIGREPLVHVVMRGESIAKIAQRYYGSQAYAVFLLKANPHVTEPKRMQVGTKLKIPALVPGAARGVAVRPARAAPAAQDDTYRRYRVRKGDSFYKIAAKLLGDGKRWPELLKLNSALVHGKPENLQAGQVIRVPAK